MIPQLTDATVVDEGDKVWAYDASETGTLQDVDATFEQVVSPFAADPSSNQWFDADEWAADLAITSAWGDITSTPTTLSGYGITDAYTTAGADAAFATAAQGTLADSATQPGDLGNLATMSSGAFNQHFIPSLDNSFTSGSTSNRWSKIYGHIGSLTQLDLTDGSTATTDTTLTRSAAGVLAVEGVDVLTTATAYTTAGADAAFDVLGAAATVQADVDANQVTTDAHAADTDNPHGVVLGDLDFGTGTDGYVWTSDGAGGEAWEASSGGGGGDADTLEGVTNRSLYSPQGAQIEHIKARLNAVQDGTSEHLTVLQIGDSLTQKTITRLIEDYLREWFDTDVIDVGSQTWDFTNNVTGRPSPVGGYGTVADTIYSNGVVRKKKSTTYSGDGDYDAGFTGTYFELTSALGDISVSLSSTTTSRCDKIIIPFLKESGAGTFKIQTSTDYAAWGDTGHASWADPVAGEIASSHTLTGGELIIDADASFDGDVVELDFTSTSGFAGRIFQVIHVSGGDVRMIPPAFLIESTDTINGYKMGEGSNSFAGATTESVPVMAKFLAALKPDVITTQSDDWPSAYENFLPKLKDAIDQAGLGYEPLVVLIGEGPKESDNYDIPASNNVQAKYASLYNWYFFDSLNIAKDWQTYGDLGYITGDPIHLDANFYLEGADRIAVELGWDKYTNSASITTPTAKNIQDGGALVKDWKARVSSNGGTLTVESEKIATAIAIDIYRLGVRAKLSYVLPFLGADLNAMEVPLIDDYGVGNATPNVLTDTEVDELYGMQKATGTDHYLDTGIDNAHTDGTDVSIGLYFKDRTSGFPLGVRQNSYDNIGWETNGDLHMYSDTNSQRFTTSAYPQTGDDGLHVVMHEDDTMRWYLDGSLVASRGADSTPEVPTKSIKLFGMDWFDDGFRETDAKIGFFWHGLSLTKQEVEELTSALYYDLIDVRASAADDDGSNDFAPAVYASSEEVAKADDTTKLVRAGSLDGFLFSYLKFDFVGADKTEVGTITSEEHPFYAYWTVLNNGTVQWSNTLSGDWDSNANKYRHQSWDNTKVMRGNLVAANWQGAADVAASTTAWVKVSKDQTEGDLIDKGWGVRWRMVSGNGTVRPQLQVHDGVTLTTSNGTTFVKPYRQAFKLVYEGATGTLTMFDADGTQLGTVTGGPTGDDTTYWMVEAGQTNADGASRSGYVQNLSLVTE
mgnify:CR=1 FL=1